MRARRTLKSSKLMYGFAAPMLACLAAGVVIVFAGGASGSTVPKPQAASFDGGVPAVLSAGVQSALAGSESGAEVGHVETSAARSIPAPGTGNAGRWTLVPASEGGCLVTDGSAIACATSTEINAGRLTLVKLSPNPLAPKRGPLPSTYPSSKATLEAMRPAANSLTVVQGVAPDGVVSARVINSQGITVISTPVTDNVYELTVSELDQLGSLELVKADGSTITVGH